MYTHTFLKKDCVIAVEANALAIGLPSGDVGKWEASFREIVRDRASKAAPKNKRPRWDHYGAPLKQSLHKSRAKFHKRTRGFKLYSTVGSKLHYAAFVDQGTSAHQASLLPPWPQRGYGYWEANPAKGVDKITVSGQRGVGYMDAGIRAAFAYKRLKYVGASRKVIAEGLTTTTALLPDFDGGTPNNPAFRAQREKWRAEAGSRMAKRTEIPKQPKQGPAKKRPVDRELKARREAEEAKKSLAKSGVQSKMLHQAREKAKLLAEERDRIRKAFEAKGYRVRTLDVYEDGTYHITLVGRKDPYEGRWKSKDK